MVWDSQWPVRSSDGKRDYTVSNRGEEWQCSCKGWTTHVPRRDCKHIKEVKRKWVLDPPPKAPNERYTPARMAEDFRRRNWNKGVRELVDSVMRDQVTRDQRGGIEKSNRREKEPGGISLTEAPERLIDLPDDD